MSDIGSHRHFNHFQHYAEEIAQSQGDEATCTIVRIEGTDRPSCLYEVCDGADCWHGWLFDGETTRDIVWTDYNDD